MTLITSNLFAVNFQMSVHLFNDRNYRPKNGRKNSLARHFIKLPLRSRFRPVRVVSIFKLKIRAAGSGGHHRSPISSQRNEIMSSHFVHMTP